MDKDYIKMKIRQRQILRDRVLDIKKEIQEINEELECVPILELCKIKQELANESEYNKESE